jgi:hypothetical protein
MPAYRYMPVNLEYKVGSRCHLLLEMVVQGAIVVASYKLQNPVIYLLICSERNWFDRHNTNIHALTTTSDYLSVYINELNQPHSTLVSIPTCYRLRACVLSFAQNVI